MPAVQTAAAKRAWAQSAASSRSNWNVICVPPKISSTRTGSPSSFEWPAPHLRTGRRQSLIGMPGDCFTPLLQTALAASRARPTSPACCAVRTRGTSLSLSLPPTFRIGRLSSPASNVSRSCGRSDPAIASSEMLPCSPTIIRFGAAEGDLWARITGGVVTKKTHTAQACCGWRRPRTRRHNPVPI
jgi:hypothetical protein